MHNKSKSKKKKKLQKAVSLSLPAKSEALIHIRREIWQDVVFGFLQWCLVQTYKEKYGAAGITFDGG